jgi:hypothetical protein
MTRYDLSKPVKTLLEYGMLKPEATFFDCDCGQGSDVRGLQALACIAKPRLNRRRGRWTNFMVKLGKTSFL